MSPRLSFGLVGAPVLLLLTLLAAESRLLSPGPVVEVHADGAGTACASCHVPFGGVNVRCVECHGDLAAANVHMDSDDARPRVEGQCASCHTEHRGVEMLRGASDAAIESRCMPCHTEFELDRPEERFHVEDFLDGAGASDVEAIDAAWFHTSPFAMGVLLLGALGYGLVVWRLPGAAKDAGRVDLNVAPQRVAEVPKLSPSYESSIEGVYIIGELAGVPLINRAMKSGFDATDFVHNRVTTEKRETPDGAVDVLIAGAGPAGLGAATRAKSLGLSYRVCEKSTIAATIRNYPRAKVVQSAPIEIPEYGSFFQEEDETKEDLTRRWQEIVDRTGIRVGEREEVTGLSRGADGLLETRVRSGDVYRSRFVILALGVRGSPRQLGVDGEVPERVFYNLVDPTDHRDKRVLVVGAGNAACEAAVGLAQPELGNTVTLSIRGPAITNATPANVQAVDGAVRDANLTVEANSGVKEITPGNVVLRVPDGEKVIENDLIYVMIGADLPTKFLKQIGLRLVRKGGL